MGRKSKIAARRRREEELVSQQRAPSPEKDSTSTSGEEGEGTELGGLETLANSVSGGFVSESDAPGG